MTGIDLIASDIDRLSIPEPNSGCWIWLGGLGRSGYGRYQNKPAHRVSFEAHGGVIPDGLVIDHLCRNILCVNPSPLEPVTTRVNTLRGIGPTAINAKKTHCPSGHPLSGRNLDVRKGKRYCRLCQNRFDRDKRLKQKKLLEGNLRALREVVYPNRYAGPPVVRSDGARYPSITAASIETGTPQCGISAACRGVQKTSGGFSWSFSALSPKPQGGER